MTRKIFIIVLLSLILLLSLPIAAQAAKAYSADRYDVTVVVQPDGTLDVTETIIFRFEGGPFTFVFRELEYHQLDAYENVRAYLDGTLLPEGSAAGQVEIEDGRPLKITWHFDPVTDETHEYRLEYTVRGAVQYSDSANTLVWRAIPEEHEYTIDSSTITLRYPQEIHTVSGPDLAGAQVAQTQIEAGLAQFDLNGLEEDSEIDVRVNFPPNSLVQQPPQWQARSEQLRRERTAAIPFGIGAALAAGALGLAGVLSLWQRSRSNDDVPISFSSQQQTPPADIAPGLAAKMVGSGNPALATLFDMARRGILRIDMSEGFLRSKQFHLVRLPTSEPLQPHEEGLLTQLFEDRHGWRDTLTFAELGQRLGAHQELFTKPLEEELIRMGWLDPERKAQRARMITIGVLTMLAGLVLVMVGFLPFGAVPQAVLFGAGAALAIAGTVGWILGLSINQYSPVGQQQAAAWKYFSVYLRDVSRGREPVTRNDLFDIYLPFAAGFGLAAGWARFFERQQNVILPEWLASLQASGGSFSDVTAAIIATQSASDSSSASAGGASGGGSSGAG